MNLNISEHGEERSENIGGAKKETAETLSSLPSGPI